MSIGKYKTKYSSIPRSRGFTLLELLIVLAMTVVLAGGISFAYSAALKMQYLDQQRKSTHDATAVMEREITEAIEGTQLSSVTTDTTSYFQGTNDSGGSDLGCDRI